MTINSVDAEYTYGTIAYRIGDRVYANDQSYYNGLYGEIVEISTDDEKGTENQGPDIICQFDAPVFPDIQKELVERFSSLYGTPKTIEDLGLDYVIMAADMLEILYEHREDAACITVFFVEESWITSGDEGNNQFVFTNERAAIDHLHRTLKKEKEEGFTSKWEENADFTTQHGKNYYECWLDDSFFENHYRICVRSERITLSPSALRIAAGYHRQNCYAEDFLAHVAQWDDISELSEEQYQAFVSGAEVAAERIEDQLEKKDRYWDAFWDSVAEVAQELLREITEEGEK